MEKPIHPCRKITHRKYSDIRTPECIRHLTINDLLNRPAGSPDYLTEGYNKGIQFILNKHAPSSSRIVTSRTNNSWYADDRRSVYASLQESREKMAQHQVGSASFNIQRPMSEKEYASLQVKEPILLHENRRMWKRSQM